MPGWLVMTAGPRCCGWRCPFWTGPGPRGCSGGCARVAPVVTQAAAGAGHWAAGRRQRALAAWASAAGFGLVAWGLGTEAPTPAEARQNMRQNFSGCKGRPVARAWPQGPGCRRDADTRGPPPRSPLFGLAASATDTPCSTCRYCRGDGHRRAVGPAPPAAADGARDRQGSPVPSCSMSCGRPGPCSGAGRGSPPGQPWSQPDR